MVKQIIQPGHEVHEHV